MYRIFCGSFGNVVLCPNAAIALFQSLFRVLSTVFCTNGRFDPSWVHLLGFTPYNTLLDEYLRRETQRGRGGFGCRTQIRLDFLKSDGHHIRPEYCSVIDRTYACALLGVHVPFPTPLDEFTPSFVRQRWESEWPRLGARASTAYHGW